jgi:flagellar hook-basal body complex protein FliE
MDIRATLAVQSYGQARQATQIAAPQADGDTANAFSEAIRNFTDTVQRGESLATAAMTTGADPYALVTALAQTELAVETAVTVRDKVVEAYQEILRMPV